MHHFKANSYPMEICRTSCDAEMGSYKAGWHICNANALIGCETQFGTHLHYCNKHASHIGDKRYMQKKVFAEPYKL